MQTKEPAGMLSAKNGFLLLHIYRSAVMGFAALWILVFHEWIPMLDRWPRIAAAENYLQRIGFCGVDIFLFLSGMGMVYSIGRSQNLLQFYYKRIKRILFPFLLVAIVRCVLESWSAAEFWKNVSGFHFFWKDMYTFLWFVPMIMTFYLLFPLYYRFFVRSSNKCLFTCGALILWLIGTLYVRETLRGDLFGFTNRIPIFLIGILVGWLSRNREVVFDRLLWGVLVLMCILGGYLAYLSSYTGMYILVPVSDCCLPNILMAVSLSFLIPGILCRIGEEWRGKAVGRAVYRILSFYGMFTLEFYCIQEWLGGKIISAMRDGNSRWKINIAVLAGVTAAALAIHFMARYFWIFLEGIAKKIKSSLPAPEKGEKEGGFL